eukprot:596314-Amphidinium_carterae.2
MWRDDSTGTGQETVRRGTRRAASWARPSSRTMLAMPCICARGQGGAPKALPTRASEDAMLECAMSATKEALSAGCKPVLLEPGHGPRTTPKMLA